MKNKIYFHTNLDDIILPEYTLDILPPIGARVLCQARYRSRGVNLEVHGVTLVNGSWEVELHIPSNLGLSIRQWHEQYVGIDI